MSDQGLHAALVAASEESQAVVNYYPTRFLMMLHERGAIETCTELILRPHMTDGLVRLWKEGRLDLSVEAIVLKEPWKDLFTENVLRMAHKQLDDLGYFAEETQ